MQSSKRFKASWHAFVHVLGQVQTTVLLSVVYHAAIGPIALVSRLLRKDFLVLRPPQSATYAVDLPEVTTSTERAKKQF
jgi:hypothetical protein